MAKIIKKFRCTMKTEYGETISTFSAVIKRGSNKKFVMNVIVQKYVHGMLKADNTANEYFLTYEGLIKEMKYHYHLCKKNLFTTEIIEL